MFRLYTTIRYPDARSQRRLEYGQLELETTSDSLRNILGSRVSGSGTEKRGRKE